MARKLDYKDIGKRVKIARFKADMKQERLAESQMSRLNYKKF